MKYCQICGKELTTERKYCLECKKQRKRDYAKQRYINIISSGNYLPRFGTGICIYCRKKSLKILPINQAWELQNSKFTQNC